MHRELELENAIAEALKRLNWHYGRGDYVGFTLDLKTGYGRMTRYVPSGPYTGREETRQFRLLRGDTVRFAGHQRKIKIAS